MTEKPELKKVLLHVDSDLYWQFKKLAFERKLTIRQLLHEAMQDAVAKGSETKKL